MLKKKSLKSSVTDFKFKQLVGKKKLCRIYANSNILKDSLKYDRKEELFSLCEGQKMKIILEGHVR